MSRIYLTTSIPYVNARPHVGHALELVQADVLARHWRSRGHEVRFLAGTDDHASKNALAAEAAGIPVQDYVDTMSASFEELREQLQLSYDDFIRTSRDARHRPGVERFWRACLASGDLYKASYEGLYCVGCEQFYQPGELANNFCAEHDIALEAVREENWFFRLSRYSNRLREVISSGKLSILPEGRRNEVLATIDSGLVDFSVSRPTERTRGWGIPVPADPSQTIYVWWDALGNYITALRYGTEGDDYRHWWLESDRRVHLIGKGIVRFHAIYWPAMLLSAREPLPTDVFVHDYLTVEGRKISKTLGNVIEPGEVVAEFGPDPVRWWLLRAVPRSGDADFRRAAVTDLANQDLADGIGNLVTRTVTMVHRYRQGVAPPPDSGGTPELAEKVARHLERFDLRSAAGAILEAIAERNREINRTRPWDLAREEASDANARRQLDRILGRLVAAERTIVAILTCFLPGLSSRAAEQLGREGHVGAARPLFPRVPPPGNGLGNE